MQTDVFEAYICAELENWGGCLPYIETASI